MTHTVGVDIGGTKTLGVVLDADRPTAGPVAVARRATPRGEEAVLSVIVAVVDDALTAAGRPAVDALGVGLPGLVDRHGVLRTGPNLPGVVDLDVTDRLAATLGVPVVVDNDGNCAAWAERRLGACQGSDHAVVVTLGTGIGAGVITGGRLVRGAHGLAAEPGHMIVDPAGPRCPCGRRGCWERFASGSGLGFLAREAATAGDLVGVVDLAGGDPGSIRGEHVTAAARSGDVGALAVMEQFGWWVALGVANLVNLLDPDQVVLGGGLVSDADLFLAPTRAAYRDLVLAGAHRPPVPIDAARTGENAGAIGAALLAAERGWGRDEANR